MNVSHQDRLSHTAALRTAAERGAEHDATAGRKCLLLAWNPPGTDIEPIELVIYCEAFRQHVAGGAAAVHAPASSRAGQRRLLNCVEALDCVEAQTDKGDAEQSRTAAAFLATPTTLQPAAAAAARTCRAPGQTPHSLSKKRYPRECSHAQIYEE